MSQVITTLHVTGMSCNSCVNHVKKALSAVGGVEQITIDLESEQVTVAYQKDETILADIEKTVEDAGYEVVGQVESSKD